MEVESEPYSKALILFLSNDAGKAVLSEYIKVAIFEHIYVSRGS